MSYLLQINGKRINNVSAGKGYIYPLESSSVTQGTKESDDTVLSEVLLKIEDYTLIITNKFTLTPPASIDELIGTVIKTVEESDSCIKIRTSNGHTLSIDLSEEAYFGPEALVLHGPDNLCVVWN